MHDIGVALRRVRGSILGLLFAVMVHGQANAQAGSVVQILARVGGDTVRLFVEKRTDLSVAVLGGLLVEGGKYGLNELLPRDDASRTCTIYGTRFVVCPDQVNPGTLLGSPGRKLDTAKPEDQALMRGVLDRPELRGAIGSSGPGPGFVSRSPGSAWLDGSGGVSDPPSSLPWLVTGRPPSGGSAAAAGASIGASPSASGQPPVPGAAAPSPGALSPLTLNWGSPNRGIRTFTLMNRTGLIIDHVYVRKSGDITWSERPVGTLTPAQDGLISFTELIGPCRNDVKIQFYALCGAQDNASCQRSAEDVDLCKISSLKFSSDGSVRNVTWSSETIAQQAR